MKRPVIGVTPLYDSGKESLWMLPHYLDGVLAGGGIPLMLPLDIKEAALRQLAERLDGFLFTGGQDVEPALYGREREPLCGETSPQRDALETALLALALEYRKPVLGICRGLQLINAALGGTLYQDLPSELDTPTACPTAIVHRQQKPYDAPVHTVQLLPGLLRDILAMDELPVNSLHHQAVRDLSPRLRPAALAPDGLVEAAVLPEAPFVLAVQWHPEFLFTRDSASAALFRAFVEACENGQVRGEG